MGLENKILKKLLSWDKLLVLAAFLIPILFFREHALELTLVALICAFSKANPIQSTLKAEVHCFLIAVTAHIYGFWAGIFLTVITNGLELKIGPYFKNFPNPVFSITDVFYMSALSFVAAIVPTENLMLASMLTIILADHIIINILRFNMLPDWPKQWINSAVDIFINYFLFAEFLGLTIAFLL